jgi:hypothetical protein
LVPEGIVVTFSEKKGECTVSGPTELPPGEYTYVYRNPSVGIIHIAYLLEGKTIEDLLRMQGKPGRYWPKPDWVAYAKMIDGWRNESRNERYTTFSFEEGELVVYIDKYGLPPGLWFCAPLRVK